MKDTIFSWNGVAKPALELSDDELTSWEDRLSGRADVEITVEVPGYLEAARERLAIERIIRSLRR